MPSAPPAAQSAGPRRAEGPGWSVEAIQALIVAKRSARPSGSRPSTGRSLVHTGPDHLRARFTGHTTVPSSPAWRHCGPVPAADGYATASRSAS